ncbi:MAG: hypothetical protein ACI86M_001536 [Saprospiraceae bacterium]|jgi:uncharacterized protein YndB with AHSA1/START domain
MIVIEISISIRLAKVWEVWNNPNDINQWYSGHKDWHTYESNNQLKIGESFIYSLMSNDKKASFNFKGIYTEIDKHKKISFLMEDNRKVETFFLEIENKVIITQKIEVENQNSTKTQALWWKTILCNFKKHTEY